MHSVPARRTASNKPAADGEGGQGEGGGGGGDDDDEGPEEEAGPFITPEQVGRDLKELDEVFAILAQVGRGRG